MNKPNKSSVILKQIFDEKKLSRTETAKDLMVSNSLLSMILNGQKKSEKVVSQIVKKIYHDAEKKLRLKLFRLLHNDNYNLITILDKAGIQDAETSIKKLLQNG